MKFNFEKKKGGGGRTHAIWRGHIKEGPMGDGGCVQSKYTVQCMKFSVIMTGMDVVVF